MRYDGRSAAYNNLPQYRHLLQKRGLPVIRQYLSADLRHPTPTEIADLTIIPHMWSHGDQYWKVAAEHYSDPKLWWVIAWYNQRPTEHHFALGDIVHIPKPLSKILSYLGV
jgi:hypothetical protein